MDVVIGIVLAVIYAAVELRGGAKKQLPDLPEERGAEGLPDPMPRPFGERPGARASGEEASAPQIVLSRRPQPSRSRKDRDGVVREQSARPESTGRVIPQDAAVRGSDGVMREPGVLEKTQADQLVEKARAEERRRAYEAKRLAEERQTRAREQAEVQRQITGIEKTHAHPKQQQARSAKKAGQEGAENRAAFRRMLRGSGIREAVLLKEVLGKPRAFSDDEH